MPEINETYKEKISFNKRLIFLYVTFGILGIVFYYQIFNLQISNYSEYEIAAINNKNEEISVQPLRGIIFDRNGEILVNNVPTFDLVTKPFVIDDPDGLDIYEDPRISKLSYSIEQEQNKYNLEDLVPLEELEEFTEDEPPVKKTKKRGRPKKS